MNCTTCNVHFGQLIFGSSMSVSQIIGDFGSRPFEEGSPGFAMWEQTVSKDRNLRWTLNLRPYRVRTSLGPLLRDDRIGWEIVS